MTYRARIFLWSADKASDYVSEQDLAAKPTVGERIEFMRDGGLFRGHVKFIAPANWDPGSALIPAVHVTQWSPAGPAAERDRPGSAQASRTSRR